MLHVFYRITSAHVFHPCGPDHFRHLMALHRPRPAAEAYLRLHTLPGEQAQVDWGHFGHIEIGRAKRPLMAFVMVLSYSRKIFLRFYLNLQQESMATLRNIMHPGNILNTILRFIYYNQPQQELFFNKIRMRKYAYKYTYVAF